MWRNRFPSQGNDREGHALEAPRRSANTIDRLVQGAVAACDEQVIIAVANGGGCRTRRVTFGDGHDDVHRAHVFTQPVVDQAQMRGRRIRAGNRIHDQSRLHAGTLSRVDRGMAPRRRSTLSGPLCSDQLDESRDFSPCGRSTLARRDGS